MKRLVGIKAKTFKEAIQEGSSRQEDETLRFQIKKRGAREDERNDDSKDKEEDEVVPITSIWKYV